jgi:hypothetical protein
MVSGDKSAGEAGGGSGSKAGGESGGGSGSEVGSEIGSKYKDIDFAANLWLFQLLFNLTFISLGILFIRDLSPRLS